MAPRRAPSPVGNIPTCRLIGLLLLAWVTGSVHAGNDRPGGEEREDALVRSLPAAEAARRTGRTRVAVWQRRRVLGVPDGRRKENKVR